MQDSDSFEPGGSFGVLIQGPPKTGKTFLGLMFPNPWVADCEDNLSGAVRLLRSKYPEKKFKFDPIGYKIGPNKERIKVPLAMRWEYLLECTNKALEDEWVKSIMLDNAGAIADILCDFIISKKPSGQEQEMTIKDWYPFRRILTAFITNLRKSGKYIIMTSHEEYSKDEGSGKIITRTNIPSKLADNFGGFFSDAWRTEIDEVAGVPTYYVRAMPTPSIPAIGNSLGLPKTFITTPDSLAKALLGESLITPK